MKNCKHELKVIGYTNEIYIENGYIIAFCGWCGSRTKTKINYCPLCRQKIGGRKRSY